MTYSKSALIALASASAIAMTGCGSSSSTPTDPVDPTEPVNPRADIAECTSYTIPAEKVLAGDITTCTELDSASVWTIDGLVAVKGTTLKIQPGTTIVGLDGTGDATSYMIIDIDAKIMAEGTVDAPIVFRGEAGAGYGEWGGLTVIGNATNDQVNAYEVNTAYGPTDFVDLADNSGVLSHVKILNSGITMAEDKEINGLSLIAVGTETQINDITVDNSDDDGVEIWGGTVNLTNVTITNCTDDYFDIDDGYNGTVKNLTITQETLGNAAIEMSGDTAATFDGFTITQNYSDKEGGIFFKKDGIGGHFMNGTVTDNNMEGEEAGAIYSQGIAETDNISFENVTLNGTSTEDRFTGESAAELEAEFNAGTGNIAD
ncbi:MAG: hypothetical protein U9O64_02220 [Campylobacterota bacterium]|nr:hypothetical protein [Campylobacterota bacterium]